MALKRKVKDIKEVKEELRNLYIEKDGEWVLDVEGGDDEATALKNAKQHEVTARKAAEKAKAEAEAKLEELQTELAQARNPDTLKALEKSWANKYADLKKTYEEAASALTGTLENTLLDNVVTGIASKFKSPSLVKAAIRERLQVDLTDVSKPTIRVLDKDRKPSAASIEDYTKELVTNPEYADIVIGTKGSGGGAPKPSSTGGAGGEGTKTNLATMPISDLVAHLDAKKGV